MHEPLPIDYAKVDVRRDWARVAKLLGVVACVIGAVVTLLPLWPLWGFYHVPIGTMMRPMGLTFLLAIFAAGGLLLALPLSGACLVLGWRDRKARWIALLGFLLSISATCIGFALYNWIVAARHFVLED